MDGHDIQHLIKHAKKGNAYAFGELYSVYAQDLYRFALYTLKDTYDAEDAVQNAAVNAYRKIRDLKKDESFRSWFFKILYNECRKLLTSKPRLYEVSQEDMSVYDKEVPSDSERSDLLSLLDTLPHEQKAIVVLSVFDGYTSEEIGEILGMKASTVRSTLSRLLSKLRKQLEGADNE